MARSREANAVYMREYYQRPEVKKKWSERVSKWQAKNPEKVLQYKRKYAFNNPEKVAESNLRYVERNSESINARKRAWQRQNLAQGAYNAAKYKCAKRNRTPPWANLRKIERIYQLAAWASRFTDEKLHVDHIIPMRGQLISGLHVENNLQILPATQNKIKYNHYPQG